MFEIKKILNKKKITIVITDSGLGGMSVCAGIEQQLRNHKSFEEVSLIFFNALPERSKGYNSIPDIKAKAEVFNNALLGMEKNFSPDIILIACNTLSIVYPHTHFAKVTQTLVLGIVEFGVSMITSELEKNPAGEILILGTPTTINSQVHKKYLIDYGFQESKIINQACPDLESEIQYSPSNRVVKELIYHYLKEAITKLNDVDAPIIAALCCTHYVYSRDIFSTTFNELTDRQLILLDPNELMIDSIIIGENRNRYPKTEIHVNVVSRSVIKNEESQSIGELIKTKAPLSSKALINYELNFGLFEF